MGVIRYCYWFMFTGLLGTGSGNNCGGCNGNCGCESDGLGISLISLGGLGGKSCNSGCGCKGIDNGVPVAPVAPAPQAAPVPQAAAVPSVAPVPPVKPNNPVNNCN